MRQVGKRLRDLLRRCSKAKNFSIRSTRCGRLGRSSSDRPVSGSRGPGALPSISRSEINAVLLGSCRSCPSLRAAEEARQRYFAQLRQGPILVFRPPRARSADREGSAGRTKPAFRLSAGGQGASSRVHRDPTFRVLSPDFRFTMSGARLVPRQARRSAPRAPAPLLLAAGSSQERARG